MNKEFYLSVSGRVHHLFLSIEGLCASREKTLQCQTRTSMGSMTGCNSVLSSDCISGYDTSHNL